LITSPIKLTNITLFKLIYIRCTNYRLKNPAGILLTVQIHERLRKLSI